MFYPRSYNFMSYGIAQPVVMQHQQHHHQQQQQAYPPYPYRQTLGYNRKYSRSILAWLRRLLIPSLIAVLIASALVRNTEFAVRTESSNDDSVWLTTLVFACVALFVNLLVYFAYLCNVPNWNGFKYVPWTILIAALFDVPFALAFIVLGVFNAIREAENQAIGGDFRNRSLNRGAFGVASAFSFLTAILFAFSGIAHICKRRAPKRSYYASPYSSRFR